MTRDSSDEEVENPDERADARRGTDDATDPRSDSGTDVRDGDVGASDGDGELLYETTHEEGLLAETVAQAVASAADADPREMQPLYESVDPEALENLFDAGYSRWPGRVEFRHAGFRVVIEGARVGVRATD
jgi:hypothetical protein